MERTNLLDKRIVIDLLRTWEKACRLHILKSVEFDHRFNKVIFDKSIYEIALPVIIKMIGTILSFLMIALLARSAAPAEFEKFSFLFSASILLSVVVLKGKHIDAVKLLSRQNKSQQSEITEYFIATSLRSVIAIWSVFFCVSLVLFYSPIINSLEINNSLVVATFALVLATAIAELFAHIYRSLGSYSLALMPKEVGFRIVLLSAAAIAMLTQFELKAIYIIWFMVFVLVTLISIQLVRGARYHSLKIKIFSNIKVNYTKKEAESDSAWANTVLSSFSVNLPVIIVGLVFDISEAAILFISLRFSGLLQLPTTAINMYAGPELRRKHVENDFLGIVKAIRLSAFMAGVLSFIGLFLLWKFGWEIIDFMSADYVEAYYFMILFGMARCCSSFMGPIAYYFMVTGKNKLLFKAQFVNELISSLGILIGSFLNSLPIVGFFIIFNILAIKVYLLYYAVNKNVAYLFVGRRCKA